MKSIKIYFLNEQNLTHLNSSGKCSSFRIDTSESLAGTEIRYFDDTAVCVHQNVITFDIWIL